MLNDKELEAEKEYLLKTLNIIHELIGQKDDTVTEEISDVNKFKEYFWSSISDMDDVEISTNMQEIDSKINYANENIRQLSQLKKSLESPYFGRVDFYMDDDDYTKVYIGINGISEKQEFYVFDWRSPIGSLFYNHEVGKASYTAPLGEIIGEIKLKRQYKIEKGNLVRCFDSSISINDDYLQEILANSSNDKMKNIVNTIQKEQNVIIRNVTDKLLIVQGVAGSGKTSVALHRIAYLLYKEKGLTSNNILIFSPNSVFSEYISNVLPELGEQNVMHSTFSDFSESYLKEFKYVESFTDFIERYYKNHNEQVVDKTIQFKLSDDIKPYIDDFINEYKKKILFNGGLIINNNIITKEELDDLMQNKFLKYGLNDKFEAIAEYICSKFDVSEKRYARQIKKLLIQKVEVSLDLNIIYEAFIESLVEKLNIEKKQLNKNRLDYEDLIPYLYLKFELFGYPNNRGIKHVVIDEAQDYTNLQFTVLSKIFEKSSFTILGDVNQTINPYYKHNKLDAIFEYFSQKSRYIELNKTYRSSEEIIAYSNNILGLENSVAIRHNTNNPVIIKEVSDDDLLQNLVLDIENMTKDNNIRRVAIITKNDHEALNLFTQLKNQIADISIVSGYGKTELSNIVVLPSYLAKGLEFDGVIVYTQPENSYSENDKHLYYVVCTRAQHKLIVYNQKYKRFLKK